MSRLPVELIDIIIAFLSSDRAALRICSLVCKDWLPASRRYLIPTITLRSSNRSSALVELLTAPSSTIAKHVHTVYIYWHPYEGSQHFSTIAQPLEKLVGVKTLTVFGSWDYSKAVQEWELERLSMWFANITTLDISVDISHYQRFYTFLHLFRSLRVLRLEQRLSTCILPGSMQIINTHFGQTPDFTLANPSDFRSEVGGSLRRLQQMLHSWGPSIQLLDISFSSFDLDVFRILGEHLACLSDLQVMRIDGIDIGFYPDGLEHFPKLVSQITSECLTKIALQFQCLAGAVEEGTTLVDWTKLAHTLSHPRFARLERVEIGVEICDLCWPEPCPIDEWISRVRKEMHALDIQGCLFVSGKHIE